MIYNTHIWLLIGRRDNNEYVVYVRSNNDEYVNGKEEIRVEVPITFIVGLII